MKCRRILLLGAMIGLIVLLMACGPVSYKKEQTSVATTMVTDSTTAEMAVPTPATTTASADVSMTESTTTTQPPIIDDFSVPWDGLTYQKFVILQWGKISEAPIYTLPITTSSHQGNLNQRYDYYRVEVTIRRVFEGTFTEAFHREDVAQALTLLLQTTYIDVPYYCLPWIVSGEEVLLPLAMMDQYELSPCLEWYQVAEDPLFLIYPMVTMNDATLETTPPSIFPIRNGKVMGHENDFDRAWYGLRDYARVRNLHHPEIPLLGMTAAVEDVIKVLDTIGVETYKY